VNLIAHINLFKYYNKGSYKTLLSQILYMLKISGDQNIFSYKIEDEV